MKHLVIFLLTASYSMASAQVHVAGLRCEDQTDPVGIDKPNPRLSWILETGVLRNKEQHAYRIQVATEAKMLQDGTPDLWESNKVVSGSSNNISYGGKKLVSNGRCYWRVKVWDEEEHESVWSEVAQWQNGLLAVEDWKAKWMMDTKKYPQEDSEMFLDDPTSLFRKEFFVRKDVLRATLHVSGLGYYEASLNDRKVGDHVLDPGWTDYTKRVCYSTYDVSAHLKRGENCAGIETGNGWYNPLPLQMWGRINLHKTLLIGPPQFIFQLHLLYTDGTEDLIVSDETWKASDGAILRNNLYIGEKQDARQKVDGWNTVDFKAQRWRNVKMSTAKLGVLQAQQQPPVKIQEEISPLKIWRTKGKLMVDMGVNFAGVIRLNASGPAGHSIRVRYGELIYPDSTLNVMTSVAGQIKGNYPQPKNAPDTAYQCDTFILGGKGLEVFQPKFTFHGFRYAEITDYPGTLLPENITGLRLHADVEKAGSFECSNPLFNQIQRASTNTFLSNLFSVQSDCPHRERFGYGGDMLATSEAAMYNFDMSKFYEKAIRDYADAMRPNGGFTETAPFVGIGDDGSGGGSGPMAWGAFHPIVMFQLMQYYGNEELIREQYPVAKKWLNFLTAHSKDLIVTQCIGDHESLDPKSVELTSTAFFYATAHVLQGFAKRLGYREDEAAFGSLAAEIKTAFLKKFLRTGTGEFDIHTQADQAFAFYFDLVPEEEKANAWRVLTDEIILKHHEHIATGMFGTKYLLDVLTAQNHHTLAHTLVDQRTFPGWGYMMERGATTIWEHWEYSDNTYSHNHPMWASVSEWFYKRLLGIQVAADAEGFNKIIIEPAFSSDVTWAKGYHTTLHGTIKVDWKRSAEGLYLNIAVPANTEAAIHLPATSLEAVQESNDALDAHPEIKVTNLSGGKLNLQVGSGVYSFFVKN